MTAESIIFKNFCFKNHKAFFSGVFYFPHIFLSCVYCTVYTLLHNLFLLNFMDAPFSGVMPQLATENTGVRPGVGASLAW